MTPEGAAAEVEDPRPGDPSASPVRPPRSPRPEGRVRGLLRLLGRDEKGEAVAWAGALARPGGEALGGGALGRLDATAKRVLDVALSGAGLLVSLPVSLLLAAALVAEDGGPVFYAQERVGRGGGTFTGLKFRSMRPLADGEAEHQAAEREADRITRVGRLMRATALDELPQLWNIFRGDMSFVGPRALMPREAEPGSDGRPVPLQEVPGYRERHSVRPGLTGMAQVHLRRDATRLQKFRYDLLYVRTRTLRLDLALIARSVWISLRGAWPEVGREA
ncbi:MAG: sugar transferase [Candidatus Palauibacterales bacterium]|nr:sugar transferase [Candidatus Palauibacterales bacterium]MDP2528424.1 sugar transferase [Candidatus Palauibacterales bacterium]MDP2583710.1 sugar transferase [Candidatus Palauibacterales bacterium]